MSRRPVTAATGSVPRAVGIWIELDLDSLATARDDPRIRHARGLVLGLDTVPEVEEIVVPCLPAARGPVEALFTDGAEPGRPLSPKLRVVAAGRDRLSWLATAAWAELRLARCRERLAASGCTAAPRSWSGAVVQVAEESPGRPFKILKRLVRVARLAATHAMLAGILKLTRALPTAHAWLARDLRRRGMAMPWLVAPWAGCSAARLPGPAFLDLAVLGPADGGGLADWAGDGFRRLAAGSRAVVVPSRHAAACLERALAGRSDADRVAVIPPANRPGIEAEIEAEIDAGLDEAASRVRLADELRTHFSGGDGRPLHRHYCDFPFERVDYLLATPPPIADGPLLAAYAAILRRHRRDLKLMIVGRLPSGPEWPGELASLGLVFDVIEAAGLPEATRLQLVRHARGVVVAAEEAGRLPEIFPTAVASGTPVVLGRLPATREAFAAALPADPLAEREYFEPGSAVALEQAILHVLDHRAEVLARQRAIVATLEPRTWPAVVADYLAVLAGGVAAGAGAGRSEPAGRGGER